MNSSFHIILGLVYFLLSVIFLRWYWKNRHPFWQQIFSLGSWVPTTLFVVKCCMGGLYTYVAVHFIPNQGDIGLFFEDGLALYRLALTDPIACKESVIAMFSFNEIAITNTQSDYVRGAYSGIKMLHFGLNFLSFGNLYINTLLFNLIVTMAVLRLAIFLHNNLQRWQPIAIWLLFPSLLFYSSGIHKEGLVLLFICLLLPNAFSFPVHFKNAVWQWVVAICTFLVLFFFKFLVALALVSAWMAWLVFIAFPRWQWRNLLLMMLIGIVFCFAWSYWMPAYSLLQAIVLRQQEFLILEAGSRIYLPSLEDSPQRFAAVFPFAVSNVLFKPLPGEGGKWLYLIFSVEIIIMWSTIIFWLIKYQKLEGKIPPILLSLAVFAAINLLLIGYIVPNIGALVRYRSLFLPIVPAFFWWLFRSNKTVRPPAVFASL